MKFSEVAKNVESIKDTGSKFNNEKTSYSKMDEPIRLDSARVEKVKCINEHLEGKNHPETGVPFEKRIVNINENGTKQLKEVVAPNFDKHKAHEIFLPKDLFKSSDNVQFKYCNNQLKSDIKNNPLIAKKFTPSQLEQIKNGDRPKGYTWHHDVQPGKMQLVKSEIHSKTGHTGGREIYGGGSTNR